MYAYKVFRIKSDAKKKFKDVESAVENLETFESDQGIWISDLVETLNIPIAGTASARYLSTQILRNEEREYLYLARDSEGHTVPKAGPYIATLKTIIFLPIAGAEHAFMIGRGKHSEITATLLEGFGYQEVRENLEQMFEFPQYNLGAISTHFRELWTHSFKDRNQDINKGTFYGEFLHNDAELNTFTANSTAKSIGIYITSFNNKRKVRVYRDGRIQVPGLQNHSDPGTIAIILDCARQLTQFEN
jgi:hypothetical protein